MAGYKEIDMTTWKRSQHCAVFRSCVQPEYCVSFELDISNFLPRIKAKRYSTTFALIYAITQCANEIEEFRYRFMDGKVVLFDCVDTAFTYLNQETELFKFVNVPMQDTMAQYVELAANTVKQQTAYFTAPPANSVFIFSPMP
jgi:chloramphenicol O-acetyltransferase type B